MLTSLYFRLLSHYPSVRRVLWQWVYQLLASATANDSSLRFMNYGYASLDDCNGTIKTLLLRPEDEANRLSIQLYDTALHGLPIKGKDCLEVGSGRGGGVLYIAKYLDPKSVIGIDLSTKAVQICCGLLDEAMKHVRFQVGNAENLPLEGNSVDLVFNVESSHCYPSVEKFILEVRRVLRPGGHFAWTDFCVKETERMFDDEMRKPYWMVVKRENFTPNVLRALELMSDRRTKTIQEQVPAFMQHDLMNFMGTKEGITYQRLLSGDIAYRHYQLQKIF